MTKRLKIIKGSLLLLIIGSLLFPILGHAEKKQQDPAGFTVESIIPENQVDKTKTYYYLSVEPAQKQTIQVKVKSTKKEPVTISVAVHDAVSSSVGAIDYANPKPKLDKSLQNPITSLVKVKDNVKEVTVKNFEEKIVEYEITPSKEKFSGVKLGSLRFVRKGEESEKNKSGLTPEYARVIALMLTEDEEQFNHGAELHLKKVGLDLSNGRKVIAAKIQNDQPKVLQEMTINGQITRKGESEVLAKHQMENFSVAPNSNFNFELPLGLERFEAGTYVFTGEAKGDGRTWKWEETFKVGKERADQINEETVFKLVVPQWVPWTAGILLLCLIGMAVYLKRRQQTWQERK